MATLLFRKFNEDGNDADEQFRRTETLQGVRITGIDVAPISIGGDTKLVLTVIVDPATVPELPPRWRLDYMNRLVRDARDDMGLRYRNVCVQLDNDNPDDMAMTATPDAKTYVATKATYFDPHLMLVACISVDELRRMVGGRTFGELRGVAAYEQHSSPNIPTSANVNRPVSHSSVAAFKTALGINKASRLYAKWREEIALETGASKPKFKHVPGTRLIEFDEPVAAKKLDRMDSWKDSVQISVQARSNRLFIGRDGLEVGRIGDATVFVLGVDRSGARPCLTDRPRWNRSKNIAAPLMGDAVTDRQPDTLIFWPSIAGWHGVFCLHMVQTYAHHQNILRKYLIPIFADRDHMDKGTHPLTMRGLAPKITAQIATMPGGPSALAYFLSMLPKELAKANGPIGDESYGDALPPSGHMVRQASNQSDNSALCDSSYYTAASRKGLSLYRLMKSCVQSKDDVVPAIGYNQTSESDPREVWTARHTQFSRFQQPVPGAASIPDQTLQPVARLRCLEM